MLLIFNFQPGEQLQCLLVNMLWLLHTCELWTKMATFVTCMRQSARPECGANTYLIGLPACLSLNEHAGTLSQVIHSWCSVGMPELLWHAAVQFPILS